MKTAVVLLNLGGPDRPESIRPFLFNFFMDPAIIRLPYLPRLLLAGYIALTRSVKEAKASYDLIGGHSPLLPNTMAQAEALQALLPEEAQVFVSMRYWHPLADNVAKAVKAWGAEKVILLPLYPQFSTTTTRSSFKDWDRAAKKCGLDVPTERICCYPYDDSFVVASAEHVVAAYRAMPKDERAPRVLFSAHGLPKNVIEAGDPYQEHCTEGAKRIATVVQGLLGLEKLDYEVCYQSKVGRLEWLSPSTDTALEKAGREGVPVLVYPHAFVNEHVETLAEIEIEYRHAAKEHGVPAFARVPVVGVNPHFMDGLAGMVKPLLEGRKPVQESVCTCSGGFGQCWQRERGEKAL